MTRKLTLKRDVALVEMTGDELAAVRGLSISCPIVRIRDAALEFADAAVDFVRAVSAEVPSCACPIET